MSVVLDVGANEGQFVRALRSQARYEGRVVSFEPFQPARAILEGHRTKDEHWSCEPYALGRTNESGDLFTFPGSDWNSLHRPHQENLALAGRTLPPATTFACEVRRLDGLWPHHVEPDDVVFLKSDTQGHDLEVLAGTGQRLPEVSGLLLEASVLPFYETEVGIADLISQVDRLGFTPSGFFPVARRKQSLALTTVDICFVRTSFAR